MTPKIVYQCCFWLEGCQQLEYNPTLGTGRIFIWEPNRPSTIQKEGCEHSQSRGTQSDWEYRQAEEGHRAWDGGFE
ncbi:MAG: hypothetical protein F6K65_06090 [Moorea sp. SIO3C2]|nr:hypothetical protein [Moorena sp. SIO3C2]